MAKYFKKLVFFSGIVLVSILLLIAGVFVYLKSDYFLTAVLSKVNSSIPGSIIADRHEISFLTGKVGIKGVSIKDSFSNNVISCDDLYINIAYTHLLKWEIFVEELILNHPKVNLAITKEKHFNLKDVFLKPKSAEEKKSNKKIKGIPFNIQIKNLNLTNGEFSIEISGKKFVSAVKNIDITADGNLRNRSAFINLNAEEGTVKSHPFNIHLSKPIEIQGQLNHTSIESLSLKTGTALSDIAISGDIQNVFSNPDMRLTAQIDVSLSEIQELFSISPKVAGQAKGSLLFSGTIQKPYAQIKLKVEQGKILNTPVEHLSLNAELDKYIVFCKTMKFNAFESTIDVDGEVDLKQVFPDGFAHSKRDFNSLAYKIHAKQKNGELGNLPWLKKRLKGEFDSEMHIAGKGVSLKDLTVSGDLCLTAKGIRADKIVAPVDLNVETTLGIENGFFSISCLKMNSDSIVVDGEGKADLINGTLNAGLFIMAPGIKSFLTALGLKDISGTASLNAAVSGSIKNPHMDFTASANDLSIFTIKTGNVITTGSFSDGTLKIDHAAIQNNMSNMNFHGTVTLFKSGTFTLKPLPDFSITIGENIIFLEDFINAGKGQVTLSGEISGAVTHPEGGITVSGAFIDTGIQQISSLNAQLTLEKGKIHLISLAGNFSDNESFAATGWFSIDKAYQISLLSKGIPLKEIDWLRDRSVTEGILDFKFTGNGTIDHPQLNGDIHLKQFAVQGQQLEDFNIHLDMNDKTAHISGRVDADLDASIVLPSKQLVADISCKDTDLSTYFNILKMPDYSGIVSGKIHVNGDLDQINDINASANISQLRIFHNKLKLADAGPFNASYNNHMISIPDAKVFFLDTSELTLSGHVDLQGPLSLKAHGRIPLNTFSLYVDELFDIQGYVDLDATLGGTIKEPDIQADLICSDLEFTIPKLYQKLYSGKGTIHFNQDKVLIDNFSGKIDSGDFNIWGSMDIEGFKPVFLNINLNATTLPIYVPDIMDLYINADLNIKGSQEDNVAKGDIVLLEGVYYKDMKLMPLDILKNVTKRKRSISPASANKELPFLNEMVLDIDVKQRSPLLVDNNLAQLSMHTDVNVTGALTHPVISGQTKINEGLIFYLRKEFNVTHGVIDFINPYKTDPHINVSGEIEIRKWTIVLKVNGPPDHLGFEFSSDPALSQEDILSLLVSGRLRSEIENPEQQPSQSTSQMLAGIVASTFQKEIKKTTGLDILEVETEDATSDTSDDSDSSEDGNVPSERIKVTLGKQLTKRLTMKYGVESKQGEVNQEVSSEYKFIDHIIFNGSYDTLGAFGAEFVYRLEFR